MKPRDRLRIATQKNGRLSEPGRDLLARSGLSFRESRDRLFCYGESLPIDLLLVRDDDIPGLLADGTGDLGLVGRNVLEEQRLERERAGLPPAFREIRALGFGRCRLAIALPQETEWQGPQSLEGLRIATSYPNLTADWLQRQGVQAEVVTLSGSVEIAPKLGTADLICDLVSSGATLLANQLKPVETLLESEAVLAGPARELEDQRADLAAMLLRRMEGVLKLKDSKLLMFRADRDTVPALLRLLPDADPPTYLAAETGGPLSLQTMCHGLVTWQRLEELERAGAQGLMVLSVERSLA